MRWTYLGCNSSGHEDLRRSILLFAESARDTLNVGITAIRLDVDGKLVTVHYVVSGSLVHLKLK